MSEAIPYHPKTMNQDIAVTTIEKLMMEALIADHTVALNGLGWAYERALRDRYPHKDLR